MLCCICGHRDAALISHSKDKKVVFPICMLCFEHGNQHDNEKMEEDKDDKR